MIPVRARGIVLTCIYGVVGGLVAVAFHHAISAIFQSVWVPLTEVGFWEFAIFSFFILLIVGLVSGVMLSVWAPEAAGSGIPQLKVAYWRDMGAVPLRAVVVKFLAGAITVGGGMSLGREGPTVQMAGGLASWIGSKLGVVKFQRRTAAACGAAAGLAAAFNTPIAAVTFVLEEIIEDLNSRSIGRILLASVVAVFVLYLFTGTDAVFRIPVIESFDPVVYLLSVPVGALAALIGVGFQKATLSWRRQIRSGSRLPGWARPTVGALITWVAACAVFAGTGRIGVLGLGYGDLGIGLAGQLTLGTVAALLLAKFVATTASYAWGGCGGIFAPTLFLGAMTGCLAAQSLGLVLALDVEDVALLAVVGMSACLGAVVRAPITSILIVFEMTHDFALMPPLMIAAVVSQGLSRWLCEENFYSQVLLDDGIHLGKHIGVRDFADWKTRRVAAFATFEPVTIERFDPESMRGLLEKHHFAAFPVVDHRGKVRGLASREDIGRCLEGGAEPKVLPPGIASPDATLGDIERTLIEAPLNMVLLVDQSRGTLVGLFTLHDLLRSQLATVDDE